MTKILHIDDDIELGEMLCEYLRGEGFEAEHCANPIEGLKKLADDQYQLVVLDVMMPQQSGLETLKQIRLKYNTPVLMLTARDTLDDKLKGFEAGADDYLVKPFALQELHARLQALYKRSHGKTDNLLTVGELTLNRSTLQVHRAGRRLELNPTGMKLLQRLMEEAPAVVDRDALETLLWADELPDGDALRSHMYKLRQAIDRPFDSPLLHTVHRIGYRIAEDSC